MRRLRALIPFLTLSICLHVGLFFSIVIGVFADLGDESPIFAHRNPLIVSWIPYQAATPVQPNVDLLVRDAGFQPTVRDRGVNGEVAAIGHQLISRSIDDYLPPSRLHRVPKPVGEVVVDFENMGFSGLIGNLEIMLLISSSGEVDDVLLVNSTLPGYVVDAAIKRFKEVKYVPGKVGSMEVRSRIRILLTPPSTDELMGNPNSAKERAWTR